MNTNMWNDRAFGGHLLADIAVARGTTVPCGRFVHRPQPIAGSRFETGLTP